MSFIRSDSSWALDLMQTPWRRRATSTHGAAPFEREPA